MPAEISMTGRDIVLDDHTSTTAESMEDLDEIRSTAAFSANGNSVLEMELEEHEDRAFEKNSVDLSWRLDPEESMSDWTIMIKTKGTEKVDTYHVHKSILGCGPRRSNYFSAAFRQVDQQNAKNAFMMQHQNKIKKLSKQQKSSYGSDMFFLGEFFQESCDFVLAGATPLLDMVGAEHRFRSGDNHATLLELAEPAAKVFPALLDYAYGHHMKSRKMKALQVNTRSATALHYLGDKLEMKLLRKEAREFWKSDLNLDNLMVYYHHARLLGDDLIAKYAAGCLSVSILELEQSHVVYYLKQVDSDFMMQVMHFLVESQVSKSQKLSLIEKIQSNIANSKRLSLLVAIYCNLHRDDPLSLPTLERLTDAKYIPEIDVKAAQVLLQLENDISKDYSSLTSLKRRCISVLSEQWDSLQIEDMCGGGAAGGVADLNSSNKTANVTIPRLEGPALAHFVVRSLTRAKRQLDGMESIRREWQDLKTQVNYLTDQVQKLSEKSNGGEGRQADDDNQDQAKEQHEAEEKDSTAAAEGDRHTTHASPTRSKVEEAIMFF